MEYPCIPIWMKSTPKDPFDYPLRTKKDIMFDQEICPPDFPVTIIKSEHQEYEKMKNVSVAKSDLRNFEVKLELDITKMGLGPVQLHRLKFLLGNRYRKNNKFKIVVKQFLTYEKNMQRACDIIQQLYWETLRAPAFLWERMRPKERRKWNLRLLGKTKEERENKMKQIIKYEKEEKLNFEKIANDKSQFSNEEYQKRIDAKSEIDFNNLDNNKNDIESKLKEENKITELEMIENLKKFNKGKFKLTDKAREMFGDDN